MKKILTFFIFISIFILFFSFKRYEEKRVRIEVGETYLLNSDIEVLQIDDECMIIYEDGYIKGLMEGETSIFIKNKQKKWRIFLEIEKKEEIADIPNNEEDKDNPSNENIDDKEDEENKKEEEKEEVISKKIQEAMHFLKENEISGKYSFKVYGTSFSYMYEDYKSISKVLFEDLVVTEMFIPKNTKARPGTKRSVYYIVIHDTGNTSKTAGALNHNNYLRNTANNAYVSWHYTVDDSYIIQNIPDDEVAYHAGDGLTDIGKNGIYLGGGNKNGIGIEMAVNEGSDFVKTMQKTAKLTAKLMKKYNLSLSRVKPHYAFSGKNCPQTILNAKMWDEFMEYVEKEYLALSIFDGIDIKLINLDGVLESGRRNKLNGLYTYELIDTKTKEVLRF